MTPHWGRVFQSGLRSAGLALIGSLVILLSACTLTLPGSHEAEGAPSHLSQPVVVWSSPAPLPSAYPVFSGSQGLGLTSLRVPPSLTDLPPVARAWVPPMGWNGYNHYQHSVTADIVEAEARALISSGMKAAGYDYVIVDGGWDLHSRNRAGSLVADPAKFPRGIKAVADYVHSLGLKFGLYTSAGYYNCAGTSAGSYGHYWQDARTFASWGVDYLKLDWCYVPYYQGWERRQVSRYLASEMSYDVRASGRPIILDVNDWTGDGPWTWAAPLASVWRVPGDIKDSYASMVNNFSVDARHASSARPGAFNDPDMLEVGNGGMTTLEYQSEFSLWAMLAAPLIAGNDLTTMTPAIRNILTNRAVIAVDQDRLGEQATVLANAGGHWVLVKPLADGSRALIFFDQTNSPAIISVPADQLGLNGPVHLLNLWSGDATSASGSVAASVLAHGVVMYKVSS